MSPPTPARRKRAPASRRARHPATLGPIAPEDNTETITPRSIRAELPRVTGVVSVYTEGEGLGSRPLAVSRKVVVGRADDADLTLPDKKASRRHAELE
ncbi:MAG: FHA domain-containing protein, partial [Myxococcales bacterium]|nr:FHA domain-containing protein [Myxococcales bacterium]